MKQFQKYYFFLFLGILLISCDKDDDGPSKTLVVEVNNVTGMEIAEFAELDSFMMSFMNKWCLPGGQLAITKNDSLMYSRGFGQSDINSQMEVKPHHLFRIASISKYFTFVAILKLIEEGKLHLDSPVFGQSGVLNEAPYLDFVDDRIVDISVRDLLFHKGGWDRSLGIQPILMSATIAKEMGVAPPAEVETVIQYMLKSPLDFEPGTKEAYSNFGYMVLGRVIEAASGMTYEEYVNSTIVVAAGAEGLVLSKTSIENRADNEVTYYYPNDEQSSSAFGDDVLTSPPYGSVYMEAIDAAGGWASSAELLLKVLRTTDKASAYAEILNEDSLQFLLGELTAEWGYWGGLPGSTAFMILRPDGVAYAAIFNSRHYDSLEPYQEFSREIRRLINRIELWPKHNLFR